MTTCPRRMTDFGPWEREPDLDDWGDRGTCTFCGSLRPDQFMELVQAGAEIGPTDKNYKAYVEVRPSALHPSGTVKFYFQHLSEEQRERFIELHNMGVMQLGYPGYFYVKPFFVTARMP